MIDIAPHRRTNEGALAAGPTAASDAAPPHLDKPPTILFYIDSAPALPQCTAAAEILRQRLSARIVLMTIDSAKHKVPPLTDYEVYDYAVLFGRGRLGPAWGGRLEAAQAPPRPSIIGRVLLFARSIVRGIRSGIRAVVRNVHRAHEVGTLARVIRPDRSRQARVVARIAMLQARLVHRLGAKRLSPRARSSFTRILLAASLAPLLPLLAIDRVFLEPLRRDGRLLGQRRRVSRPAETYFAAQRFRYWLCSVLGVRRFIAQIKPDVIILGEDNIETLARSFVTYGRRHGARTLLLPFTIPNPLEPAHYYRDNPRHQMGRLARLVARIWPKWCYELEGRPLLRLDPLKVFAIEVFGLSTPAPWVLNRGGAASIALDSDAQRDRYLALGFPPEQLTVIGDSNGEALARGLAEREARCRRIMNGLGMPAERPLVVCAFPPDQYSGASQSGFEFRTFEALVSAWMESFQRLGDTVNVIVRPHPRLDPKILARYERPNIRVCQEPTVDLIPIADLFVASISATIRWAISCGVPVINYDCYRLRYGDFLCAEAVVHIEDLEAFEQELKRFFADPEHAATLKRLQLAASAHWGIVDNRYDERLACLVQGMIAAR